VARTPLSAGSICRPGRSHVQPVASHPEFLIAKFSRLERPVTPSKQMERTLSNSEKSEGLHFAPRHQHFQASDTECLTSPVPANSNRLWRRLGMAPTRTKQRTNHLSNRRKSAILHFTAARRCFPASSLEPLTFGSSSTFDGYVYGNNRNIIRGTLQAGPVSNVQGTRPAEETRRKACPI
jgi:hypothetical protein